MVAIKNEELIRKYAPAAFATAPEEGRVSDRYTFLPTTEILSILQDEGWTAWKAQQVQARKWSKDHAKHIIRLRHEDLVWIVLVLATASLRCCLSMPTTVWEATPCKEVSSA